VSAASTFKEMSSVSLRMTVFQAIPALEDEGDPESAEMARLSGLVATAVFNARVVSNGRDKGVTRLLFDDSPEAHGHGKTIYPHPKLGATSAWRERLRSAAARMCRLRANSLPL
jgi:hypothetical protein